MMQSAKPSQNKKIYLYLWIGYTRLVAENCNLKKMQDSKDSTRKIHKGSIICAC